MSQGRYLDFTDENFCSWGMESKRRLLDSKKPEIKVCKTFLRRAEDNLNFSIDNNKI